MTVSSSTGHRESKSALPYRINEASNWHSKMEIRKKKETLNLWEVVRRRVPDRRPASVRLCRCSRFRGDFATTRRRDAMCRRLCWRPSLRHLRPRRWQTRYSRSELARCHAGPWRMTVECLHSYTHIHTLITQSTFWRISIGYLAVRDRIDYQIAVLCYKAVKLQQPSYLFILVYSRHTDSRSFWCHLRQTYCQHSLHRQTLLLVGSNAAPHRLGQSSLICICTANSFTSFRSQLKTYVFATHLQLVRCPRLWYAYRVFHAL